MLQEGRICVISTNKLLSKEKEGEHKQGNDSMLWVFIGI